MNLETKIKQHGQKSTNVHYKALKEFLEQYKLNTKQLNTVVDSIRKLNNPNIIPNVSDKSNVVDQSNKIAYKIPSVKIDRFMYLLDQCRENNLAINYAECQSNNDSNCSGIMLDFDILQNSDVSQINDVFISNLLNELTKLLWKLLELPTDKIFHIGIIKKPQVVLKSELSQITDTYKDGFHILIPGIQINKETKELIYDEIIQNNVLNFRNLELSYPIVATHFLNTPEAPHILEKFGVTIDNEVKHDKKRFREFTVEELTPVVNLLVEGKISYMMESKDILKRVFDKGSIRVPVLFIGNSKEGAPPYVLHNAYELKYKSGVNYNSYNEQPILNTTKIFDKCPNLCYEFSLMYQNKNGIISKENYKLRLEYQNLLLRKSNVLNTDETNNTPQDSGEIIQRENRDEIYHEDIRFLSSHIDNLEITDQDIREIRRMLKMLSPERVMNYEDWFKILCALHSSGDKYKLLAQEFTFSVLKYKPSSSKPGKFENTWKSIKYSRNDNKININTLYYYCYKDNPEEYSKSRGETSMGFLLNKIIQEDNGGNFSEADYAQVILNMLGYKYCSVEDNGKRVWYEFISETDNYTEGQIYKWIKLTDLPSKMVNYINDIVTKLIQKIIDYYVKQLEEYKKENNKEIVKHFQNILKTLKIQKNSLGKKTTSSNIISLASHKFSERYFDKNFMTKLDSYENCLGVGNGVLYLSNNPRLITGYHEYVISKYTNVYYFPYHDGHYVGEKELNELDYIDMKDKEIDFKHLRPENMSVYQCYIYRINNPYFSILEKGLRDYYLEDEEDVFEFDMIFLASCLDFRIKDPAMLFKIGNGANGKSTILELMKSILGDYCKKLDLGMLVQGRSNAESASPAKMQLENARLVYYSESQKNEELNVAKMKEFLGCETLAGRNLHSNTKEFKPRCNHIVSSNYKFIIKMKDHGTWRRLYIYNSKITFVDEHEFDPKDKYQRLKNPDFVEKYVNNDQCREAFLSILVHYYRKYMTVYNGRITNVPCPTMDREKEEFRNEQDVMNKFIHERVVYSPKSEPLLFDKFADEYSSYCMRYNNYKPDYSETISDLQNSYLKKFIKAGTSREIEKHRILDYNTQPLEGEMFIMDVNIEKSKAKIAEKNRKLNEKINNANTGSSVDVSAKELEKPKIRNVNDSYVNSLKQDSEKIDEININININKVEDLSKNIVTVEDDLNLDGFDINETENLVAENQVVEDDLNLDCELENDLLE